MIQNILNWITILSIWFQFIASAQYYIFIFLIFYHFIVCFAQIFTYMYICAETTEPRRGHQISMGLELQIVMSCHVGAGNQTFNILMYTWVYKIGFYSDFPNVSHNKTSPFERTILYYKWASGYLPWRS